MSNVLAFPNRRVAPVESIEEPEATSVEPIEALPVREPDAEQATSPVPKVLLPLPVFERMLGALTFYARAGFDHGREARSALGEFTPHHQPQESA
ncbi:hypothetical protein C0Q88_07405 [Ralstonia pickettii]|uniref:Uncharacterized protein n=1 Tax=Ralstonia pickettii TaxID=329 RepID=A0A2N4TXS8_RALPI|nr:hypothetical protein [Ralstonia pickettii]PLC44497.1 hypothetical protein C0Q88_07405 [Ralstonia pickettii]